MVKSQHQEPLAVVPSNQKPATPLLAWVRAHIKLLAILSIYIILSITYSLITPLFEASDELWHYPMVKYVADNVALPVQNPETVGPWRQEGGQPPLYYMLGAALTFWIDTSDMDDVRHINPHADIGTIVPDNNVNMVVHNSEREAFPWSGTPLAMHVIRFFSVLMGAGTVYCTYKLGQELVPQSPSVALVAAAFTAFNPMFLFISASINNDNLSTLLASVLLLMVVRLIKRSTQPSNRFYLLLGLVTGAGLLAKFQIGFMLPFIALALIVISIRLRDWRPVTIGGAISGGLTILIAGWWYWRNYTLYGDATGINVFLDIVGRRAIPADLHQLWTERESFMRAYWGIFGAINVPLPDSIYTVFNLLAGLAGLGILIALGQTVTIWFRRNRESRPTDRSYTRLQLARFFAAAWALIVFLSLLSWTRQTWASQGRLWFSALAPLNIALAVGLASWFYWSSKADSIVPGIASLFFAGVAVTAPFMVIHPAYQFDPGTTWTGATHELSDAAPINACFREPGSIEDALCLTIAPLTGAAQPGDYVYFTPVVTVEHDMSRTWSLFVHILNEYGTIEAQRDVLPGGGLIATENLNPGEVWNNPVAVQIPIGVYTPQTLDVCLGFYTPTPPTFERMSAAGPPVDAEQNCIPLGKIDLLPATGTVPNTVNVNFDGKLTLLGYEVTERALKPGDTTDVTFYWNAAQPLEDYVISVQIINPDPTDLTKIAQIDMPPTPPTSQWIPDEMVTDTRSLTVFSDAKPGRYRILVRVYPIGESGNLLRTRPSAGGQSEDFVWLTWIQVE